MRNKLFALFILIGVIAGFVLLYMYFFLYYTSTLVINANIDTFQVSLFSKKTAKTFEYSCSEKICTLTDIPPFEYNMTLSASGYIDVVQSFTLKSRSKQEVVVNLEKEVILQKIEDVAAKELSVQEKIQEIRKNKEFLALFPLTSGSEVGIKETASGLEIYFGERKLATTSKTQNPILQVLEIPDTSYVYFHIAEFQGLYDTSSQTLNTFVFVPTLKYIKKGGHSQELIFVTDKGSFIYNINTKVFTYFYLFLDYVTVEDGYIGVIYKDEEQKKKNYDLSEETQNLIIRFNPSTKEREILYRTSLDVKKILKEGDQIYFETSDGKYKLENY